MKSNRPPIALDNTPKFLTVTPMTCYINWAYQSPGANEKLNPKPTDKKLAISRGYTRIDAETKEEAVRLFELAFPTDRVEGVT